MNNAHLKIRIAGSAIENGQIDVNDLAPALLAIGELIQAANTEINGDKSKMSVKVRATAEGSFEVDLVLWQSMMDSLVSLFEFSKANSDGIAAANDLVDLLFKAATPVVAGLTALSGGLLALFKFLKGRKPDSTEIKEDGSVSIQINNEVFITNQHTIKLAQSIVVREKAKKAVDVLSKEGIDTFEAISGNGESTLTVTKEDQASFDYQPTENEDVVTDEVRTMALHIVSLSFKETNKWRVSNGADTFYVTIEDEEFINRINAGVASFAKNDCIICDVREKQLHGHQGLRLERVIIKVKEHRTAPRQLGMEF